jgi:aryl-phospho-beta-D-glucosidase BglC (GH1 family)
VEQMKMKFNIFRNPFIHQYVHAWQDGFDEGFKQGREMTLNEVIGYQSLNEDKKREERRIKR